MEQINIEEILKHNNKYKNTFIRMQSGTGKYNLAQKLILNIIKARNELRLLILTDRELLAEQFQKIMMEIFSNNMTKCHVSYSIRKYSELKKGRRNIS